MPEPNKPAVAADVESLERELWALLEEPNLPKALWARSKTCIQHLVRVRTELIKHETKERLQRKMSSEPEGSQDK